MKAKRKASAEPGAGAAGLPREEWDFAKCPPGRERHCFLYEYAREAPWIVDDYRLAQKCGRKVKFGWQCGFDEFGNWHFWSFGDSERHDDWGIVLQVPPGFPESPYLKVEHHPVEPKSEGIVRADPPFCEESEWLQLGVGSFGTWTKIQLNWDYPNKRLVAEFEGWLERNRPKAPRERRGSSPGRRYLADLKALGAYRLMVKGGLTAEGALAYTKKFMPHGLYAKVPDWYEAKGRVLYLLEEEFRYSQEIIAAQILAEGWCETCKARGSLCGTPA